MAFPAGFVLLTVGLTLDVPSTYIDGGILHITGDAYNYKIDAALRGSTISGAVAAQAIYISVGVLLMALGLLNGTSPEGDSRVHAPDP